MELHAPFDLLRRLDIFDFVSHAVDAPLLTRRVQGFLDIGVQTTPLLEGPVQEHLPDFGSHTRLGQESNCVDRVIDCVTCLVRIVDLEVQDSINLDLNIILSDGSLSIDIKNLLFKTVMVGHFINDRNFEVKSRF